jgi:stearoyl-CoA desaturase (Delta-9 desaturase)
MENSQVKNQTDWINAIFLISTPILTILFVILYLKIDGFNPTILIPTLILYFITGISITAGYHRLFSHRSFKAHPLVKAIFLIFGAATFQNSALKWCTDHRRHHLECDTDEDPYSITKGFFHAHFGWLLIKEKEKYKDKFAPDLVNDPLVLLQHKFYLPLCIIVGFGLPIYLGYLMGSVLGGIAIVALFRIVFVHHMTFFINSLCHMVGTQPYSDLNTAKDSPVMAVFTYGEGYHNFHHQFQTDFRNGIRFYDFDPTKWTISLLSFLGLAWDLKKTPQEDIIKAKIMMDGKRLERKYFHSQEIKKKFQSLISDMAINLDRIKTFKKELQMNTKRKNQERILEIKKNIELAKVNLKYKLKELSYLKKRIRLSTNLN